MEEEINQIEELFTAVMQATDADDRQLSTAFMLLPSKKVRLNLNCLKVNLGSKNLMYFLCFRNILNIMI